MKISIPILPPASELVLSEEETRCRQLMQSFIAERYTESLMEVPEIQKAFVGWLEDRSRTASHKTMRWEFRRLRSMAARHPALSTLEREAERVLLDTRNVVANKSIKAAISRLIDEKFLKEMQAAITRPDGITDTMRNAFVLFSATLMTGLRPTEWRTASLLRSGPLASKHGGNAVLVVQTAKARGEAELERTLVLEDFRSPHLDMVESAIEIAGHLTNQQLGHLSTGLRRLAQHADREPHEDEALSALDLSSGRKMFAVECLRDSRSKKEVAAAMGHTTTVNLRWYAQGDIHMARAMRYPLAKATREAALSVRDTLQEFKDRQSGLDEALGNAETITD